MIGNKPFFQKETSERRNEFVAVIAYGWEKPKFYAEWFGDNNGPLIIKELKGPVSNAASPQSELAPVRSIRTAVLRNIENPCKSVS
ncbi:MAG: hypothetical protein J7K81_00435 [Methanophagales archaeon]|nr:hypothetical protein [Methanophagales archaeon]